ncbi:hypothetical protein KUL156_10840 [Alteromonas sp. KUL156]|nr:hypothetical protein KUL154_43000 [Alteromonas sp. KUL154]GFD98491.1 hypothetical protein KUL156_10840 [Alteromonas sp. KUL156]
MPTLVDAQEALSEENGVLAALNIAYKNDSNVQRNGLGRSDDLVAISPDIAYTNYFGKHALNVGYSGEYTRFSDQSNLNFENHSVLGSLAFDHSLRFTSKITGSLQKGVEDPSQVNSLINNFEEFTKFKKAAINGEFAYGRKESIGQIVIGVDAANADYDNNQQEFRNMDSIGAYTQFFYRVAPNTRAVVEVSYYDYDYDDVENFLNQSSQQASLLAGLEWIYSDQLSTSFRAGYQTKNFEDVTLNKVDGLSFALEVVWQPTEHTNFDVEGSRSASESTIAGLPERVSTSISVNAEHELTQRLRGYGSYVYAIDDFGARKDTNNDAKVGITYGVKHWLDVTLEYQYQERDSAFENFSYNANVVMLSFEMAID